MDEAGEDAGVGVLAREPLGDTDALDGLGQRGGHPREALLLRARGVEDAAAEVSVDGPHHGGHGEQHEEQARLDEQHRHRRPEHLPGLHERDEQVVLQPIAHLLDVPDHAADERAVLARVEEGQGMGEQVPHHPVAQVAEHALAQLVREADPPVKRHLGQDRGPDQRARPRQGRPRVMVGERTADDVGEHPGQERQLDGACGAEREEPVAPGAVAVGQPDHAAHQRPGERHAVGLVVLRALPADGELVAGLGLAHGTASRVWTSMARR